MIALNLHVFLVLLTLMARPLAQDALVVFAPHNADKVGVYDAATETFSSSVSTGF